MRVRHRVQSRELTPYESVQFELPQTDDAARGRGHRANVMTNARDLTVRSEDGRRERAGLGDAWRRRLTIWRSPAGQLAWARPTLLSLAVVAGVAYGWQMGSSIEIYYAAAARSMSMSWHEFVYGAFDPAGTISVDKLPGALWIEALSVRLFGVHTWAIALPQVLEGFL